MKVHVKIVQRATDKSICQHYRSAHCEQFICILKEKNTLDIIINGMAEGSVESLVFTEHHSLLGTYSFWSFRLLKTNALS